MENNQQASSELATTLLAQVYSDYQKEKRWAKIYRYMYYAVITFFVLLAISAGSGSFNDKKNQEVNDKPYVAVIKMHGGVGEDQEINAELFEPLIEDTFKQEHVVGVVIDLDSPGGAVYDTYMIYEKLQQMKQKYPEKKLITYIRRISASAGYWISSAGDHIYSTPVSLVGSIGVRTGTIFNFTDFVKEHKINTLTFQSGRFKTMGDPFRPWTDEEKAIVQSQLEDIYSMFVGIVQLRRGDKLSKDPDLFSGLTWTAPNACKKGLIDYYDVSFEDMIQKEYGDYVYRYVKPKSDDFTLAAVIKEIKEAMASYMPLFLEQQSDTKKSLHWYA